MMTRFQTILLLVSLFANVCGLFVLYKAYDYRKKMILAWAQSQEWVSEYNKGTDADSTESGKNPLVFVGASITANWDLNKYFPDVSVVNKGIDGQYAGQLLLRFKHDVLDLHPKGVLIKLCEMNFSHFVPFKITQDNLIMMATLAKANGIKPYMVSVIPVTREADKKGESKKSINRQVHRFNKWLLQYARENSFDYIDFAGAMSDADGYLLPELTFDGIHPNEKGYKIMTGIINEKIIRSEEH